jgi:transcriptional regulator with XRE-family HTH domain
MPIPAYGVRFRQARLARQLTQVAVAKALRVSQSYIAQLEGGRSYPSAALAAKIAKVLGADLKVEGDTGAVHHLEHPAELFGHGVTAGRRPKTAERPRLPIVGAAIPGDQERIILDSQPHGSVAAPPQLENVPGAQALYVRGRSMEPRYFPGELIYVDPRRRPNPGDFVLVLVHEANYSAPIGYVRQYLGERSGKVRLVTFSPKREHLVSQDDLVSIHTIVGSGLL